jgi:hypothetical protein
MRTTYLPHSQKAWEEVFRLQACQSGHGMVGYKGTQYQRGAGFGSLIGGLVRSFLPVAKNIGKAVGKQALKTGAAVATDALSGRNFAEAAEEHGKAGALKLIQKGVKRLDRKKKPGKKKKVQKGRGLGYRPKSKPAGSRLAKQKNASRVKRCHRDQLGVYYK